MRDAGRAEEGPSPGGRSPGLHRAATTSLAPLAERRTSVPAVVLDGALRPQLTRSHSSFTFKEATRAASPFAGSLTELQKLSSRPTPAPALENGDTSMSSAPVETLHMSQDAVAGDLLARPSLGERVVTAVLARLYPPRARVAAPPDVLVFLCLLGLVSALLAFLMDISIEELHLLRHQMLNATLNAYGEARGDLSLACILARSAQWSGYTLAAGWLAIFITGRVAPEAAGSGIPEMKSILSGGMKSQENSYLSPRTFVAKVRRRPSPNAHQPAPHHSVVAIDAAVRVCAAWAHRWSASSWAWVAVCP